MSIQNTENTENTENETTENETTESTQAEIIYLKNENIKNFIKNGSKVLFLFMPNSQPSQFQEEKIEKIYESYGDKFSVGLVNVLDEQNYAISMGIRRFPTTLYFKDGELVLSEEGVERDIDNSIMRIL